MVIHSKAMYIGIKCISRVGLLAILLSMIVFGRAEAQISKEALHDSIQRIMNVKHVPGVFISVVNADSVRWEEGFGFSDLERKLPVTSQSFKIGSVTKTVTALGIMKLVSEGKLSLDDTLSRVAPELPIDNPWESSRPILIHHLLEHKAGFDDMHFAAIFNRSDRTLTAREEVNAQKNSLTSRWQPGLVHSYSNPSYAVLGYLIEKISGRPYRQYLMEEILIPLGMENTFFPNQQPANRQVGLARGYSWYDESFHDAGDLLIISDAAGGLRSNAQDFGKLAQHFLRKTPDETFGDSTLISSMEKLHGDFETAYHFEFGYKIGVYDRQYGGKVKHHFLGHSGGILGFGSDFIYSRELNLGIAISNNGQTGNRQILDLLVDYFAEQKKKSASQRQVPDTISQWEGWYVMMNSRNQIMHGIDVLTTLFRFEATSDSVSTQSLLGATDHYRFDSAGFKAQGDAIPSLYPIDTESEKVIQIGSDLYTPISSLSVILLVGAFVVTLLAVLILVVHFVVQLIRLFLKRSAKGIVLSVLMILPYLCFFVMVYLFMSLTSLHRIIGFGEMNLETVSIYLLSLALPVLSLVGCVFLVVRWWQLPKISRAVYSLYAFGAIFLSIFMSWAGWFAIAFWSY